MAVLPQNPNLLACEASEFLCKVRFQQEGGSALGSLHHIRYIPSPKKVALCVTWACSVGGGGGTFGDNAIFPHRLTFSVNLLS